MRNMKVKDLMTTRPMFIKPDDTLQKAAMQMANMDCGFLPVTAMGDVIGIITDRDIVIRAIAKGLDPKKEKVLNYMTHESYGCNEDDYLEDAAEKMRQHKVSRLTVRDHRGQVVGVLSFGGLLRKNASSKDIANIVKHAC